MRQRIGAVMKWAIAKGCRADNPAREPISAALSKQPQGDFLCERCRENRDIERGQKRQDALDAALPGGMVSAPLRAIARHIDRGARSAASSPGHPPCPRGERHIRLTGRQDAP